MNPKSVDQSQLHKSSGNQQQSAVQSPADSTQFTNLQQPSPYDNLLANKLPAQDGNNQQEANFGHVTSHHLQKWVVASYFRILLDDLDFSGIIELLRGFKTLFFWSMTYENAI